MLGVPLGVFRSEITNLFFVGWRNSWTVFRCALGWDFFSWLVDGLGEAFRTFVELTLDLLRQLCLEEESECFNLEE